MPDTNNSLSHQISPIGNSVVYQNLSYCLLPVNVKSDLVGEFEQDLYNLTEELNRRNNLGYGLGHAFQKAWHYLEDKYYGYSSLHRAVIDNDIVQITEEIDRLPSLEIKDKEGYTPLQLAVSRGNFKLYQLLKSRGADINVTDNYGNSLLHLAAMSSQIDIICDLLENNADVKALNLRKKTPIQISSSNEAFLLLWHHEIAQSKVQYLDEFTFVSEKEHGNSWGGVYQDKHGHLYVIKNPQSNNIVFKEFIAGGIYEYFLGESAPKTILIIDKENKALLIGSRFIAGFKTLSSLRPVTKIQGPLKDKTNSLEEAHFNILINHKPLEKYQRVVSAIVFLNEGDAHCLNLGAVEVGNSFHAAKVDHGLSFIFCKQGNYVDELRYIEHLFQNHFNHCSLTLNGYQQLKDEIKRIAQTPYHDLETIVEQEIEVIRSNLLELVKNDIPDIYDLRRLYFELNELQEKILSFIKWRLTSFQILSFQMEVDDALYHNDQTMLDELLKNDDQSLKPILAFHKLFESPYYCMRDRQVIHDTAPNLAQDYGHLALASKLRLGS